MFLPAHGEAGGPAGPFPPWEWHPATVHFPIAFLLGGVALDLYARRRGRADLGRAATGLLAAGTLLGLAAVATGLLAFFTVRAHTRAAHDLMYWHLGVNAAALALFAAVVVRRRAAPAGAGVRAAGLLAAGLLAAGGFLGGRIVYRGGAGVDPAVLAPELRGGHDNGEPRTPPAPGPPGGGPVGGEKPGAKAPHEH